MRINQMLENVAPPENFTLAYQEVRGLQGSFQWYIKGSSWWVRLHPVDIYPMDKLEQNTEYNLSGIVLDQAYGTVNIWVKHLKPLSPE